MLLFVNNNYEMHFPMIRVQASSAENKWFMVNPILHHDAAVILTMIGPATNVAKTVCCWIV